MNPEPTKTAVEAEGRKKKFYHCKCSSKSSKIKGYFIHFTRILKYNNLSLTFVTYIFELFKIEIQKHLHFSE